jgi:SAM-dependent methyltransferase
MALCTLARIAGGVGIDPALPPGTHRDKVRHISGRFPHDLDTTERFDAVKMLAVFEHLDDEIQSAIAACRRLLCEDGRLVMSVPEPAVDRIVHALARVGLVAGMALHGRHGRVAAPRTPAVAGSGPFDLLRHERFQLGLNNLFVFRRR